MRIRRRRIEQKVVRTPRLPQGNFHDLHVYYQQRVIDQLNNIIAGLNADGWQVQSVQEPATSTFELLCIRRVR